MEFIKHKQIQLLLENVRQINMQICDIFKNNESTFSATLAYVVDVGWYSTNNCNLYLYDRIMCINRNEWMNKPKFQRDEKLFNVQTDLHTLHQQHQMCTNVFGLKDLAILYHVVWLHKLASIISLLSKTNERKYRNILVSCKNICIYLCVGNLLSTQKKWSDFWPKYTRVRQHGQNQNWILKNSKLIFKKSAWHKQDWSCGSSFTTFHPCWFQWDVYGWCIQYENANHTHTYNASVKLWHNIHVNYCICIFVSYLHFTNSTLHDLVNEKMIGTVIFCSPSKDFVQTHCFIHMYILINNPSGLLGSFIVFGRVIFQVKEREREKPLYLFRRCTNHVVNVCEFQLNRCHFVDCAFHFAMVFSMCWQHLQHFCFEDVTK